MQVKKPWSRPVIRELTDMGIKNTKNTTPQKTFEMWVISENPPDYPNAYVARRFAGRPLRRTEDVMLGTDIKLLRRALNKTGFVRIGRDPSDDPCVIESWL